MAARKLPGMAFEEFERDDKSLEIKGDLFCSKEYVI